MRNFVLLEVNVVFWGNILGRARSYKVRGNTFFRVRVHRGATSDVADRVTRTVSVLCCHLLIGNKTR